MTTDSTKCCFRSNCETFCNLILFNYTESTQTAETVSCIRSKISQVFPKIKTNFYLDLFNCINCFKCKRQEERSLHAQIRRRLEEKEPMA